MPAEGPSFGIAPAGTCTCRSFVSYQSGAAPSSSVRERDVRQRRLRRLAHHVTELTGERRAGSFRGRGSTPRTGRRRRTGVHASPVTTPISSERSSTSRRTFGAPSRSSTSFGGDRDLLLRSARRHAHGDLSEHRPDLALEVPHAGFVGVLADDPSERVDRDRRLLRRESVLRGAVAGSGTASRSRPSPARCSRAAR